MSALASSLVGSGGISAQTGRHAAEVCEAALRALSGIAGIDQCAVFLLDPSRRRLDPALWHGHPTGAVPVDNPGVVAQVARTGEPRSVPDLGPEAEILEGRPRSALALPLRAGGETVGVLSLESRQPAAFPPAVASLCESVGQGISAALEGTNITERLLRAKLALEMTFDAMPELVAILDHDGRIRRLNKSLALRIGRPLRELIGEPSSACFPSAGNGWAGPPPRAARRESCRSPSRARSTRPACCRSTGPRPSSASGS